MSVKKNNDNTHSKEKTMNINAVKYMADPPQRRSCEVICLAHPDDAEHYAETLNHFLGE